MSPLDDLLTSEEVAEDLGYDPDDYKRADYLDDLLDRLNLHAA